MPGIRRHHGRRRGRLVAWCAAVLFLLLAGHEYLPGAWSVRLAVESALPWLGLGIPVLLAVAAVRRAWRAAALVLVPAVSWLVMFVPGALPQPVSAGQETQLVAATQNLAASNPDQEAGLRGLSLASPDILALQEVVNPVDSGALEEWPYQVRVGTIMLASKFPISGSQPLTLGLGWQRALHATVDSPSGPISIYVVHADSVRFNDDAGRNALISNLAGLISDDPAERIMALGDFNASSYDSCLTELNKVLTEPGPATGGFGFTWPSGFPVVRLDHIFTRGFPAGSLSTLANTGSDHLALFNTLDTQ